MPSTVDPSLTDDGTTVMTMFTQYGPYREEDWPEGAREAYARRCLDIVAEHAPNVKDALIHYEVLAPPDLERIFGLVDGSIFQGEQGLDQMAFMRPSPLLAQYATPVDGLYLCGAGTHPGGGVMARLRAQRRAAHAEGPALASTETCRPRLEASRPTAILLGLLIAPSALGVSTTAVALPTISADLGLSHPEAAWVLAGYVLAQATSVALFGRLGDIRGTRTILIAGGVLIGAGRCWRSRASRSRRCSPGGCCRAPASALRRWPPSRSPRRCSRAPTAARQSA